MNFENIIVNPEKNTSIVTINRPDKLNALNDKTFAEIDEALDIIEKDDNIRVVIFTGAGPKSFVAGADIKELNVLNAIEAQKFSVRGQKVFNKIENFSKPVIAAVNGFALGGGCELALACHFRVASDNAKFGLPEVNLGIIPGYGGTQRLSAIIGKGKATEMTLTGDMIDAEEAKNIGLINHIFSSEELIENTLKIADKICSKGQIAIGQALKSINATDKMDVIAGMEYESALFGLCASTEDFKEGTNAFLEKRKANFLNK